MMGKTSVPVDGPFVSVNGDGAMAQGSLHPLDASLLGKEFATSGSMSLRNIDKIDLAATVTVLFWITSGVMVWISSS